MLRLTVTGEPWREVAQSCAIELQAGEALTVELASGGHWYGHGFSHEQPYPLETGAIVNEQFAVNNIMCPIWMCSAGYVIFARTTQRLAVRLNDRGSGVLALCSPMPRLPYK